MSACPFGSQPMAPMYQEIAAIAQKRRDDALNAYFPIPDIADQDLPLDLRSYPSTSGLLSAEELDIIRADAGTLLRRMKERKLTSFAVTSAFCKAAAMAQKLTNCVTEVMFEEGLKRAKDLDQHLERTGTVVGPLHGLPISLKDNFMIPPQPSSIGMSIYANLPTEKESVLVTMLRGLGAVFYVKTNVPTAMLMGETNNRVWGETRNPIHKKLTPGGSSGGEGALLAFRGSPLGVGTDIAGSIRFPSAFCHLYGLKPSFGRFSTWGGRPSIPGQDFIYAICGPMSASLASVKLFCESVLSEEAAAWNLDPKIIPMPWRTNVIQPRGRKLRFGILGNNDGLVTCHPPVERALKITREALEKAGHEVIDWEPIGHKEIVGVVAEAFRDLGSDAILPALLANDEPIFAAMGKRFLTDIEAKLDAARLRDLISRRNELQKAYLDRWMATKTGDSGPIDGIIAPVSPAATPRLGLSEVVYHHGYTAFVNLLDYSACTFPVTFADKSLDAKRGQEWRPLTDLDQKMQDDYDADFYHGAPVSLQLIGKRLEEEKVLEMVEVVDKLLGDRRP